MDEKIRQNASTGKLMLNLDEAAAFIGLSKSYLYKLTSARKIPHSKPLGKLVYFNRVELEEWMQQNKVATMSEIDRRAQNYCIQKGSVL
ncbi:helix-turn-helix domain-containing protein [Coprobacter secundus]|uniref:Helix-turn-helix domain-containing protein n=1 Tax=Coprobacter secundus subsp. similis TaxID=2751153 RepID=A0A7G1I640_9BACT|nr:helix-turn-helix domain-containing protein [Coprobacter secundus]BCI64877.1 hypothetical protein Cop2CBH44_32300 [Coprobacter secundus subsp. similis]